MAAPQSADEEMQEFIRMIQKRAMYLESDGVAEGVGSGVLEKLQEAGGPPLPPTTRLSRGPARPIAAVDVGMAKLGETPQGVVIALRGALVVDAPSGSTVSRYYSGPLYLDNARKAETLFALGRQLSQDDYYVEVDRADPDRPQPIRVRDGVADNARHYADRFRSWFERKIQADACVAVQDGTVCFDSSLTLSTRDCPNAYLRGLVARAHGQGNSVVAVSKQSELEVMGKSVRWWLDDAPPMPCRRALSPLIRQDSSARAARILGQTHAVRFAAAAPSAFRVDVCAAPGVTDDEAIERFYASTRVRGFYPDILVRAHMHATIPRSAVWSLQAQARRVYGVICRADVSLQAVFGPFAGRFK